ncbi:MAG: sulfotransferase family protein [Actinomycetota bacterium]
MSHGPIRVVYIAGSGRSGSTIVDNILGQIGGWVSAGEVRFLWERGVLGDRLCGCGERFSACPFWTRVLQIVSATGGPPDPARIIALLGEGTRARHIPQLVRARRRPADFDARLGELTRTLGGVYRAIAEVSEARVIVDSSKLPTYGEVLRHVPGIDPYFVHLVRDPRATAFSWSTAKALPEADGGRMQRQGAVKSAALWTLWNGLAEAWWRSEPARYLRIRYDDLTLEPEATVERIVRFAGSPHVQLPFVTPHQVELAPTHGVAGNPSRFTTGVVELRADTRWRTEMRPSDRAIVTSVTWPLLARPGYVTAR